MFEGTAKAFTTTRLHMYFEFMYSFLLVTLIWRKFSTQPMETLARVILPTHLPSAQHFEVHSVSRVHTIRFQARENRGQTQRVGVGYWKFRGQTGGPPRCWESVDGKEKGLPLCLELEQTICTWRHDNTYVRSMSPQPTIRHKNGRSTLKRAVSS